MLNADQRYTQKLFADSGEGADIDEAFEDAVDNARVEYGLSGVVPSVAAVGVEDITVTNPEPVSAARAEMLAGRETLEAGDVRAQAVSADKQFKRRNVNLKIEDLLNIGNETGFIKVDQTLEEELLKRLKEQGVEVAEGETLEAVEVRSLRARFKPVVTPHPGRNKNKFVVTLKGSDTVIAEGATAGEARRNAVAKAKEGMLGEEAEYILEVSVRARREDGNALFEIKREKLTQKATLRLRLVTPKKELKTTSWLFYGKL